MHRPTVSAAYAAVLLDIVAERGCDADLACQAANLSRAAINSPNARITPAQHGLITIQAAKLTGDEGISLEWGLRLRPTAHGYLGYAMMACDTLREAIELGLRYIRIRQHSIHVALRLSGEHATIELRELHTLGWTRHFFLEAMLIGHARGLPLMLGIPDPEIELWFDYPEPAYYAPYRQRLPRVRYAMPSTLMRFPAHYLDLPLVFANRSASIEAIEFCERELKLMGDANEANIVLQVCQALERRLDPPAGLGAVAAELCMSDRTLKRKLQALGTCFQELLDEVRQRQALHMLEERAMELGEVARLLGYRDPANFTRAFKRWTGRTPSDYRSQVRRSQPSAVKHSTPRSARPEAPPDPLPDLTPQ